jgi:hypothetical protein
MLSQQILNRDPSHLGHLEYPLLRRLGDALSPVVDDAAVDSKPDSQLILIGSGAFKVSLQLFLHRPRGLSHCFGVCNVDTLKHLWLYSLQDKRTDQGDKKMCSDPNGQYSTCKAARARDWDDRALALFFKLSNQIVDLPATSYRSLRAARIMVRLVPAMERHRS